MSHRPPLPSIGVVIPVFNDAAALDQLLNQLLLQWDPSDICVVNGGSADNSAEVARKAGVRLVHTSGPCRARQLNQGAASLERDGYWFLHADALPPRLAKEKIQDAFARGFAGGAFRRRFETQSKTLAFTCWLADLRGHWFGWFLGDQGIFASRRAFERVGGFPDLPIFEDLELSRSLAREGKTILLSPTLRTSARRFSRRGPGRQTLADLLLTLKYLSRHPSPHRGSRVNEKAGNKKLPATSEPK